MNKIFKIFDKLEDKVRIRLSHWPIFYAIIGGVGTVLFWRGVWHTADFIAAIYLPGNAELSGTVNFASVYDGLISIGVGLAMLLITGLFVATFIGDHIIVSGLRGDKKATERTEEEIKEDLKLDRKMREEIHAVSVKLQEIEKKIDSMKNG